MCGITSNMEMPDCNVNHRLEDDEYVRYLEYYDFKDSEHNYKCFVIWKGFGLNA